MAERRPEERPVMPPPPAPPAAGERKASGKITERINRAYATSGPPVPDEPQTTPVAPGPQGSSASSGAAGPSSTAGPSGAAGAAGTAASRDDSADPTGSADSTGSTPSPGDRFEAAMAAAKRAGTSKRSSKAPAAEKVRTTRKARLRITHVDPWSVMKTSLLLSVAVGIVTVVAVAVIWAVLNAAGVWESIDRAVGEVVGNEASGTFRIEDYVGTRRVLGFTMLVAAVDVVLVTVVATLGAFLYNLAAALLGGVEVVLAEDER